MHTDPNLYLIGFWHPTPQLCPLNERDKFHSWFKITHAKVFKRANVEYETLEKVGLNYARGCGIMCFLDTPAKLDFVTNYVESVRQLGNRVTFVSLDSYQGKKARFSKVTLYQRNLRELDSIPSQIQILEARYIELRKTLTTRLWFSVAENPTTIEEDEDDE